MEEDARMPLPEAVEKLIDILNKLSTATADIIDVNLDLITSLASVIGALTCGYLMSVILRERTPLVYLQRVALGGLSLALLANAMTEYPSWAIIEGHRPTGALVDVMLMVNLVVMALRGHIMYQSSRNGRYGMKDPS